MGQEKLSKETVRILIVDDVDQNRFVLREIITEMGFQPILAENGSQALKIMERICPRLILLDIAMPEMDGFEFCKIMKENPERRDIPIIFISAFDDPEDVVEGFNLGGADYITKPFIPELVKARVNLHLKLYDSSHELMEGNRLLHKSVNEQLRQLEMEKKNVLYALLRVAKEDVRYNEKRMQRLCYNCRILAEAMQLSADYSHLISDTFIDTIELAAPLCDLGNVAISTEILQKTEPLAPEEAAVLQTHTTVGAKILQDIQDTGDYNDFLQMSMDIAHYHHENWDGSGYPSGKQGDDIPLAAQIVTVVSEFCTMTEHPGDQETNGVEEALESMEKDAGKIFNGDIFQIMKKIYRQLH